METSVQAICVLMTDLHRHRHDAVRCICGHNPRFAQDRSIGIGQDAEPTFAKYRADLSCRQHTSSDNGDTPNLSGHWFDASAYINNLCDSCHREQTPDLTAVLGNHLRTADPTEDNHARRSLLGWQNHVGLSNVGEYI